MTLPSTYRFFLRVGETGDFNQVLPIYNDKLSVKYSKESNEEYMRPELNDSMKFVGSEYGIIRYADIETKFYLNIQKFDKSRKVYRNFFTGYFTKADCSIDEDNKLVEVKITANDRYEDLLSALETEVDLIKLAPEIQAIKANKRPALQLYIPGEKVIGTFLEGVYFEQECEAITDLQELNSKFGFSSAKVIHIFLIKEPGGSTYIKGEYVKIGVTEGFTWTGSDGHIFTIVEYYSGSLYKIQLSRDGTLLNTASLTPDEHETAITDRIDGFHNLFGYEFSYDLGRSFVNRLLHDKDDFTGSKVSIKSTTEFGENHNYAYATPLDWDTYDITILANYNTSTEPTQYGQRQPGEYYFKPKYPAAAGFGPLYPITRSVWGYTSFWFAGSLMQEVLDQDFSKRFTIKHTYPLHSCISKILDKLNTGLTFGTSTEYSRFFYSISNPVSGDYLRLYLTPITNILKGEYDNPAQKCTITLKKILDMLKDCFKCYWFIDGTKLRIEHISYFINGGSYSEEQYGFDLIEGKCAIANKPWEFGTLNYEYSKDELPERYNFAWADDCTAPFEGGKMEAKSIYVKKGQTEEVRVSDFSSDIDFMLLQPGNFSNDNIAVLTANSAFIVPTVTKKVYYEEIEDTVTHILQNGYLAFADLVPKYYLHDLPCKKVVIDGIEVEAIKTKRIRSAEIKYPVDIININSYTDIYKLVYSSLGTGQIKSAEYNLSSNILKLSIYYDTE